ncbi:TetR/AcrR family transcriptional regulator [Amycolatopsis pithecellobii]|uniref:TetR family transcriptional regulator n=1 Tax=Amycolatopsis pithecellobii TaxID=664692 RepID=A0A6N7YL99_9PSEU|nr:TetR/AcrR family transcriptional regulator [Amycolatopsis pithecellobii]MTD52792.1 TetR family transcriptional regulator [Amycolatopsis pithecellobii]
MTTASEPRWRRLEPDQRREQIFACASRLFGERPYASVSTSDIAAAAGVARGLINHYFGTKRELYLAVIRRAVTMPAPEAGPYGAADSLPERAHDMVDWFLDMVVSQGKMWLVATSEGIGKDTEVDQIIIEAERKSAERLLDAFELPSDSDARPRLNAMCRAFGGMVKAAGREWLLRGELDRAQVHLMLYHTLIALLEDVFPKVQADAS